ncbi:MAG: hypothetical protein HND55_12400 [Pseudomonadota bacterium]|nr:MAG: hypothetical protein HND55_12400 [Pseudomonadota bacterium]
MTRRHRISDRQVRDYLRGQADPETVREIEIALLDDDELFERIQIEQLLQQGLSHRFDLSRSPRQRSTSGARSGSNRVHWPLAATLASAALGLGAYALSLKHQLDQLRAPQIDIPVVTLFEQRSVLAAETDLGAALSRHSGPALIELDVSLYTGHDFQLELITATRSMTWDRQQPDERGYITILLPEVESIEAIHVRSGDGQLLKTYSAKEE